MSASEFSSVHTPESMYTFLDGDVRVNMLRMRVLEFEKEIEEKIDALPRYETEILKVADMRRQWLKSVSTMSRIDSNTFKKKLEVLRSQAELASIHDLLETTRMQGFYEAQTLADLVEATKPLEDGETQATKNESLAATAKRNAESLRASLEKSMHFRANLSNYVCDMIRDADELMMEYESQRVLGVEDLRRRIEQYIALLRECNIRAEKHCRDVTSDYLVLRHNTRVAREMLVRSQNEATVTRQKFQERLDKIIVEATSQREKMQLASEAELKLLTEEIRAEVVMREGEAEELRTASVDRKYVKSTTIDGLKREIKKYRKKYSQLQRERREAVENVGGELSHLRELVDRVEVTLCQQTQELNAFLHGDTGSEVDNAEIDGSLLKELGTRLKNLKLH